MFASVFTVAEKSHFDNSSTFKTSYHDQNQNARGVANVAENESIRKMATKNFLKGIAEEF